MKRRAGFGVGGANDESGCLGYIRGGVRHNGLSVDFCGVLAPLHIIEPTVGRQPAGTQ